MLAVPRVNKWIVGSIVFLTGCCATRYYANVQPFSNFLIQAKAYDWLCEGQEMITEGNLQYCVAQMETIKALGRNMASFEMIGSIFAGLLMDLIGINLTAFVGAIGTFLGFLCFGFSSPRLNLLPAASVFAGFSINILGNPGVSLGSLFPGSEALVVSVAMGGQGLCTALTVAGSKILNSVPGLTAQHIFLLWGLATLPLTFIYSYLIPSTFVAVRDDNELTEVLIPEKQKYSSGSQRQSVLEIVRSSCDASEMSQKLGVAGESAVSAIFSGRFLAFNVINLSLMLIVNYFLNEVDNVAGPITAGYVAAFVPATALTGLVWGSISDAIGCLNVIGIHLVGWIAVYILSALSVPGSPVIVTALVTCFIPFAYGFKYAYATSGFHPNVVGTVLGLTAGIGALFNIAITVMQSIGGPVYWFSKLPVLAAFLAIPLIYLIGLEGKPEPK